MRCSPPRAWASLDDGTPLVTGEHRGKGLVSPVPCHRRHALVGPAAVRHLRRNAAARRRHCPATTAKPGAGVAAEAHRRDAWRRPACSTASAPSARRPPTAKPLPADYRDRATPDHPPGFYGPPEGLLAVNTLASRRPHRSPRLPRALRARHATYTQCRAATTCAAGCCSPRWRCWCSTPIIVAAARRRPRRAAAPPRARPHDRARRSCSLGVALARADAVARRQ